MDEQQRIERLAEALDATVLDGRPADHAGEELRPLLTLAAQLQAAFPPVQARPGLEASLRAGILSRGRGPLWKRLLSKRDAPLLRLPGRAGRTAGPFRTGEGKAPAEPPRGSAGRQRAAWRYAAAFAVLLMASGGALMLLTGERSNDSPSLQAQSSGERLAAVPAPAGTTAPPSVTGEATALRAAAPVVTRSMAASAAIPVLPPLSASNPPTLVGGLGGGGFGEGAEPKKEIRFEQAAKLPELPGTVTVYRYRQPSTDVEKLRKLAGQLGFKPGQLQLMADAPDAYLVSDPVLGSLNSVGPGGPIAYNAQMTGKEKAFQSPPALPGKAEAVRVATTWLTDNSLLPPGAGEPRVSKPYPQAAFEEVVFQPAQPAGIVTENPQAKVSIDADGRVVNAMVYWPEVESTLSYPARSADSAWTLLTSGKAEMIFDGEHGRPDFKGTVRITAVDTGYALTFGLDGRPYLQPVVLFRGESVMAGDPEPRPFSARVPLVADGALPKDEIGYVFSGVLPQAPSEAAALERVAAPAPTREQVLQLGRKLGMSGEPALMGGPGAGGAWELADPATGLMLRVMADSRAGSWLESWNFGPMSFDPKTEPGVSKAPAGENAIRIAEQFLRSHDLYTPDLGKARVQPLGIGATATVVVFPTRVGGLPIYEPGALAVTIDRLGEVQRVISNQHPTRVVGKAAILSPAQALEAVKAGKGHIEVPSLIGRTIYSDRAEIESVDLVYRVRTPQYAGGPPEPGEPAPMRYEPYYLFSGTAEVGESRKRVPFTTSLLAWAQ